MHGASRHFACPAGAALEYPGISVGRVGCSVWINELGPFLGVLLRDQAQRGDISVVRVGHVGFTVDECQFLGFHHHVDAFGGAAPQ